MNLAAVKAMATLENDRCRAVWEAGVDSDVRALAVCPSAREVYLAVVVKVASATGVSEEEIRSKSREKNIVQARWLTYRYAYQLGLSTLQIGAAAGTDHTTVLHGIKRIKGMISKAKEIQALVQKS